MPLNAYFTRFLAVLAGLLLWGSTAQAQRPGNWINPERLYYKIEVRQKGMQRIEYDEAVKARFPFIYQVDPDRFQVFFHGEELPIYVHGAEDGQFDPGDYIEFYGIPNDRSQDNEMLPTGDGALATDFALYAPEFTYYLTFETSLTGRGRRMEVISEPATQGLRPEPYHTETSLRNIQEEYFFGPLYPTSLITVTSRGGVLSEWERGKGYTSRPIPASGDGNTYFLPVENYVATPGFPPSGRLRVQGRTNATHLVELYGGTQAANTLLDSYEFERYEVVDMVIDSLPGFPTNGEYRLRGKPVEVASAPAEWISYAQMELTYPQATDMMRNGDKFFNLRQNTQGENHSLLEIRAAPDSMKVYDVTDIFNVKQLTGAYDNSTYRVVVPNTNEGERTIYAVADSTHYTLTEFEKVDLPNPAVIQTWLDKDFIIVTHKDLRERYEQEGDVVQAYANYRSSEAGGGYNPLVVNVEDLYTFFTEGEKTPLAIRRFADYLIQNGRPKYLFLVGKGLNNHFRYEFQNYSSPPAFRDLVPSWGMPSSDHLITAGLNNTNQEPAIPTGRLPARTPAHVWNYLQKVKEHEGQELYEPWRKRILHLSGGFSGTENSIFRSYMQGFERIAEGEYLGAEVSTIAKQTTDFVEFINIADQVNEGVSLITFFGHANIDFTDIDIGYCSNPRFGYDNKGRYPMLIVNGCGSGDIFNRRTSIAEDWLLTPDKGGILFLAHSYVGVSGPLRLYTQTFYENAFADEDLISKPVGNIMQNTIREYMQRSGQAEPLAKSTAQQFVLAGDPAVRITFASEPDYAISSETLVVETFEESFLAESDSFNLHIPIKNLGIVDKDRRQFLVQVRRTFNDGRQHTYPTRLTNHVLTEDTVSFTLTTPEAFREVSSGLNRFEVWVDYADSVPEVREDNNYAILDYFFNRGRLLQIFPKEFSIQQETNLTFIAQNTDPLAGVREYRFELDTTMNFDSPLLASGVVQDYLTPRWNADLPLQTQDSVVYYWRVRLSEPQEGESDEWTSSSFIYIGGSPEGWAQQHHFQFQRDELSGISRDDNPRQWNFKPFSRDLKVITRGVSRAADAPFTAILDGDTLISNNCATVFAFIFLTIDHNTGEIYNPMSEYSCGNSQAVTLLSDRLLQRRKLQEYMAGVKEGDWVAIFSGNRHFGFFNGWNDLQQIGVESDTLQSQLDYNWPLIILGQKGADLGTARVIFSDTTTSTSSDPRNHIITLDTTLVGSPDRGTITTLPIGPAEKWTTLFRAFDGPDDEEETWQLDVIGMDYDGNQRTVLEDVRATNYTLGGVDAEEFPFIKLRATVEDQNLRTPYPLYNWLVVYQEVPEGILFYDTTSYRQNTVLEVIQGDTAEIKFNFQNISGNDFDEPLMVDYTLKNLRTNAIFSRRDTLDALPSGQTLDFSARFSTLDIAGDNILTAYINPKIQAEQIYENNILQARFRVKPDDVNPLLDVAFDGVHIMDGDIVSSQPMISIGLKDDNQYLVRQDTVGIEMFLAACDSCTDQRVNFSGNSTQWFASPDNHFRLEYSPETPLEDGVYTLTVKAEDLNGNEAGEEPYRVRFQVINEASITNFYPYPNPFSTRMRFVFTLTGQEVPEDILIRIMTVSGKVVREITQDELGPLHIGNNITEFAWDGKDMYGDQLANGVYLYKVYIRDSQQNFKHRETSRDDLFEKGIGKIYLMR